MAFPPVVIRLAGLPAETLEAFASPPCVEILRDREVVETDLAAARASMVDAIAEALTDFDAPTRRFLLAVKRDCFNGRAIGKHREKEGWGALLRVAPRLAPRLVALEGQLLDNDRAFIALYAQEVTRERRCLLDFVRDRRFLRGVALGRPGLVRKIRSRAPSLEASEFSKRPEKWERSLLRFVTRAAAKLSANSTLTDSALGNIQALPSPLGWRFDAAPRREVSLVRLDRPSLEQLQALLLRHPAVRERAPVAWNDSIEEIEPGRYRFVRDGHWDLEPGADTFRFVPAAKVTVNLSAALLEQIRRVLRQGALRYGALLTVLKSRVRPSAGEVLPAELPGALAHLVDIGALVLMTPWPTYEPRLEQRIGCVLRGLRHEPTLRPTADALDELLALQAGFASALRPERQVAEMEKAWARLIETVLHLAAHQGPVNTRAHFFEDALLEPVADSGEGREVVRIAPATAGEILHVSGLVLRFAELFNWRHDVLHTLAAWWREHEPRRRAIPFAELAQRFAPTWKQFLRFTESVGRSADETFDPLHTASLEALQARRGTLVLEQRGLLEQGAEEDLLSVERLERLVDALPRRYAPLLPGASVFVQPLDGAASSWMLNKISQGTGRFLSRVTQVLEGPRQQRLLDHLISRSAVVVDGEEADLLEVKYPWGTLVKAHPPQTARVLEIRGVHLGVPAERRLRLGELTIEADLDAETFRVIDPCGRRVLPVQLSTWPLAQIPNRLRFLLAFGPLESRSIFPTAACAGDDELNCCKRLTCGRLVVRRRTWTIDAEGLRLEIEGLPGSRAYAAVHAWRRRLGLPLAGFYYEHTYHGKFKPQYVDFSSPSLCRLFVSSLSRMTGRLFLEEALPAPADYPFDDVSMTRRGVELFIDSFAIRSAARDVSGSGPNHN